MRTGTPVSFIAKLSAASHVSLDVNFQDQTTEIYIHPVQLNSTSPQTIEHTYTTRKYAYVSRTLNLLSANEFSILILKLHKTNWYHKSKAIHTHLTLLLNEYKTRLVLKPLVYSALFQHETTARNSQPPMMCLV